MSWRLDNGEIEAAVKAFLSYRPEPEVFDGRIAISQNGGFTVLKVDGYTVATRAPDGAVDVMMDPGDYEPGLVQMHVKYEVEHGNHGRHVFPKRKPVQDREQRARLAQQQKRVR